jgi:hypothetical protein
MSKKQKPPYLFAIDNAEQASLLAQLFEKSVIPAPQAHMVAPLWARVQACAKYFAPAADDKAG